MTKIVIKSLLYKNFKGVTDFKFEPDEQLTVVSGQNGAGKTSLADGLLWLLFGKDTRGAKLNPKPLNSDNSEQLGLEPTIEAVLDINGTIVTLKRVQEEKWTQPRGQLEKVRGNDATKYYIDTVPKKEKDWKDYLEKLGDEILLQMLTDSTFFMKMNWKERRQILVSMTGLTDEQIIDQDPELKELVTILAGHSVDDTRKILAGQKRDIKKNIDGVPARIQEVTDMLNKVRTDLGDNTEEKYHEAIAYYEVEIADTEKKLAAAKAGNSTLDFQEELSKLKVELANAQTSYLATANLTTQDLQNSVSALQIKVNDLRMQKQSADVGMHRSKQAIEEKKKLIEKMRGEYRSLKEIEFDEHKKSCPTCGQHLPKEQVNAMVETFNKHKSEELTENVSKGKALKQDVESLEKELAQLQLDANSLTAELEKETNQLDLINSELIFARNQVGKFEDSEEYGNILAKITEVEMKITNATNDSSQIEQELAAKIKADKEQIASFQYALKQFDNVKQFENRIEELKAEDKRLKEQNQDIERKLFLLDEFTRKKVRHLESSINSKFSMVQFKLFNILKNGGLEEVCEATHNGVEYGASLNTGARINCDLDIVNTLAKEFDIYMPVFVDNTESVNALLPIDAQLIELKVTEDTKLKVGV